MLHHETGTTPTGEEGIGAYKAFYHMTDPDRKALDDLCKAATVLFVMVEDESYFLAQTRKDNPEIGASEVVILTITRKHIPPPVHPLPVMDAAKELIPV